MKPFLIISLFPLAMALSTGNSFAADQPQEGVTLNGPRGGWNYAGLIDRSGEARSSYPAPPIDRGMQRNRTLIEGHIRTAGKQRAHTLVVNGNPMVLNYGEDGRFERHYAFGSGSNNIEIKTPDGKSAQRVQYYEANSQQLSPQLRIICSWDAPEAEVDLHIITPDGQHAFYAAPILKGGGGLDVDSVDGPGPEMFTTIDPAHGAYHVFVNYWGNYSEAGYNFDEKQRKKPIITTRVTLVFYENTPREKRESFVVPLRKIGDLNLVKSFMF
ncbi:YfaP family protein [Undibacterium sp. TJN19]|uniref:YfaP family protein n=1 Tax=Undibacterium sp. TJN19 TaxID=3413055 RepID=UPI003BF24927